MLTLKKNWIPLLITVCFFISVSNNARSEILVAQSRLSPAVYGGASYTVDFNGGAAGGTAFSFSTSAPNTLVAFAFNAECAVDNDAFHWVGIDILVDPAGAPGETSAAPSNSDNALCSGNDTPSDFLFGSGDGWVSATSQATMLLPNAGVHTVRVRVNGAASGVARLDDMSLIVWR